MVSRADKGLLQSQRYRDGLRRVDIQVHTRRQTQRRLSIQALPSSAKTGGEFAKHKLISKKLHTSVYFTDPYSSWQKGTVENTNKLIRQYIPKTMNINQLSYNKLLGIQYLLNQRPRKSLLFKSPLSLFYNFDC